jgi:hypothetical protein
MTDDCTADPINTESLERAVQRATLASRCLDGAAADMEAYARAGGEFGVSSADLLADEGLKVQTLAEEFERVRAAMP